MKLNETPNLPRNPGTPYEKELDFALNRTLRDMALKVNQLADGRFGGRGLVALAAPTTGAYATGDFVANSNPEESGTPGSMYVITGWTCIEGGYPGTFVQARFLTGN